MSEKTALQKQLAAFVATQKSEDEDHARKITDQTKKSSSNDKFALTERERAIYEEHFGLNASHSDLDDPTVDTLPTEPFNPFNKRNREKTKDEVKGESKVETEESGDINGDLISNDTQTKIVKGKKSLTKKSKSIVKESSNTELRIRVSERVYSRLSAIKSCLYPRSSMPSFLDEFLDDLLSSKMKEISKKLNDL